MQKMQIAEEAVQAMTAAARAAAPLEACGLVGGSDGAADVFYELTNADASADHFSMSPKEQFAAVKKMRAAGLRLVGVWHSHPATPARMSEEDLRLAFTPDTVYLITSLEAPRAPSLKGFVVSDDGPQEIELETFAKP